jgi:ABC-2 type transport system ATP-binding protein
MEKLQVQAISKSYHGKKAVDNIEFEVPKGQIVGLLGPNGAGKTTTMSIITGILAPDEGQVTFDGEPMSVDKEIAIKQKIGFLSEANPLYKEMLVEEYLDYMAGLRSIPKQERKEAIKRVAKETGIEDRLTQPIEELSKGYKQRVGLAQAILHQPELLILDEPTEGLDPNQRVTIRDLIVALGKERTVMISTHVLSEVQAMCDHVIILNEGKLVTSGTVEEVMSQGKDGQKVFFEAQGSEIKSALEQKGWTVTDAKQMEGRTAVTVYSSSESDIRPELFKLAQDQSWTVYEIHQETMSLEDTFRKLTLGEKSN